MYLITIHARRTAHKSWRKYELTQYSSVSSVAMRLKAKLQKVREFKDRLQLTESNILKGQT
jgi:hypothetical protein